MYLSMKIKLMSPGWYSRPEAVLIAAIALSLNLQAGIAIAGAGEAQVVQWTGAVSDDWFDSANWDPTAVPGEGDVTAILISDPHKTVLGGPGTTEIGALSVGGAGHVTIHQGHWLYSEGGGIGAGTVHLSGNGTRWSFLLDYGPIFTVGGTGPGTLLIEHGAHMSAAIEGVVGYEQSSEGTVIITSDNPQASSAWSFGGGAGEGRLTIGDAGAGTVIVGPNGSLSFGRGGRILLGNQAGSLGSLTVSGENGWLADTRLTVGVFGTGVLTLANGGTANVAVRGAPPPPVEVAVNVGSAGTVNIGEGGSPGYLNASGIHGGEGDATLNFNHNAPAYRFENSEGNPVVITGSTKVNHSGSGTTILGGENTYTGDTTISGGTLRIDGSAVGSRFFVKDGGTLGGFGSVGSVVLESGGFLSPGASAGTFTTAGDFTWEAGGVFLFDLGPDSFSSDFLAIDGEFFKEGAGEWAFEFADNNWAAGQTYDLVGFWTTNFAAEDFSFTNAGPFDGYFTIDGNVLQFTLTQIPEPRTYALLLGLAVTFLILHRRFRADQRTQQNTSVIPHPEGAKRMSASSIMRLRFDSFSPNCGCPAVAQNGASSRILAASPCIAPQNAKNRRSLISGT
jgi:autotransporter-associated beta strand protein/T5SS/PEP-CTERM-associated repeat protein